MAFDEKPTALAQHSEAQSTGHNVTVEEATLIADGVEHAHPSPWTPSMFRLYICLLVGYLCATTNGFDGAVMGFVFPRPLCRLPLTNFATSGINAMTSYQKYFHM